MLALTSSSVVASKTAISRPGRVTIVNPVGSPLVVSQTRTVLS